MHKIGTEPFLKPMVIKAPWRIYNYYASMWLCNSIWHHGVQSILVEILACWHQSIIWTNADLLSTGHLMKQIFSDVWIDVKVFFAKKWLWKYCQKLFVHFVETSLCFTIPGLWGTVVIEQIKYIPYNIQTVSFWLLCIGCIIVPSGFVWPLYKFQNWYRLISVKLGRPIKKIQ